MCIKSLAHIVSIITKYLISGHLPHLVTKKKRKIYARRLGRSPGLTADCGKRADKTSDFVHVMRNPALVSFPLKCWAQDSAGIRVYLGSRRSFTHQELIRIQKIHSFLAQTEAAGEWRSIPLHPVSAMAGQS